MGTETTCDAVVDVDCDRCYALARAAIAMRHELTRLETIVMGGTIAGVPACAACYAHEQAEKHLRHLRAGQEARFRQTNAKTAALLNQLEGALAENMKLKAEVATLKAERR